jgi:UDP-N-acetylmuramoylalanine--D-glutamate ligase
LVKDEDGGDAWLLGENVESLGLVAAMNQTPKTLKWTGVRYEDMHHVLFVNDSKATNVVSARRAIESFDHGVVPILGGHYKGGDFEELREAISARAAGIVTLGEAAGRIEAALGGLVPMARAASMQDAVAAAFGMAPPGGVVLLAPGCSSFDMFSDYIARGRAFRSAVAALAETQAGKPRG